MPKLTHRISAQELVHLRRHYMRPCLIFCLAQEQGLHPLPHLSLFLLPVIRPVLHHKSSIMLPIHHPLGPICPDISISNLGWNQLLWLKEQPPNLQVYYDWPSMQGLRHQSLPTVRNQIIQKRLILSHRPLVLKDPLQQYLLTSQGYNQHH
jgi:hypothetical protein